MSYLNKVERQREGARLIEERHKARRRQARASAAKAGNQPLVEPAADPGWFKEMIKAMDPRLWKSKATLAHEAEIARKKAEIEGRGEVASDAALTKMNLEELEKRFSK